MRSYTNKMKGEATFCDYERIIGKLTRKLEKHQDFIEEIYDQILDECECDFSDKVENKIEDFLFKNKIKYY